MVDRRLLPSPLGLVYEVGREEPMSGVSVPAYQLCKRNLLAFGASFLGFGWTESW